MLSSHFVGPCNPLVNSDEIDSHRHLDQGVSKRDYNYLLNRWRGLLDVEMVVCG